jgi:hypothetical protein
MQVLQLEMERLSLQKATPSDRGATSRLKALESQLEELKEQQGELNARCVGGPASASAAEAETWLFRGVCVRGGGTPHPLRFAVG